ncbi:MAG: nucleoside deaminase [Chitinophagales bacterium]|nr:nucleoside deaminase [Chitinophagales bacterium]MDW8393961.1 nucleoside deaminase [Chitinophagales bacterium]
MPITVFSHEHFMREALRLARRAEAENEIPIGAVVVAGNQIVGKGYNQTERLHDVTAHAEMLALTAASNFFGSKYLTDCTLYCTIEPCPMCAGAVAWAQIPRLVYGAPDPKKGYSLFTPNLLPRKVKVVSGILEQECAQLMRQFFLSRRVR